MIVHGWLLPTRDLGRLEGSCEMGWFRGLRRSRRALASGAAVFLTVGLTAIAQATPAAPAHASSVFGFQFCYGSQCLNAWDGGPAVDTFPRTGTNNNLFEGAITSTRNYGIQFQGTGGSSHDCIGDWNNSSTNARAGLYSNCVTTQPAWGANFTEVNCANGGIAFKNIHWNGYLGPQQTTGTGVAFYLNKPTPYCFDVS